jgi:hypothetical protein
MEPERESDKLKKDLTKSRAEIAALQKKLQATLLKKSGGSAPADKKRPSSSK